MAEATSRVNFGGKGYEALAWNPLPFMEAYLAGLAYGDQPRTASYVRSVKVGLSRFASFAASQGILHPEEITREHVLWYQAYLTTAESERGVRLSPTYQRQLLAYLRGWLGWLRKGRYIRANPWRGIRVGRVARQVQPMDVNEIADLLLAHRSQAFRLQPFVFHRREFVLVALFGMGLRLHEIQSLNVEQFAPTVTTVTVRDQRGGAKRLPVTEPLKDAALRWLTQRARYARPDESALLIDQRGGRMNITAIRNTVTALATTANIRIEPHRLRDTIGTRLVDATLPVEQITALMGYPHRCTPSPPS